MARLGPTTEGHERRGIRPFGCPAGHGASLARILVTSLLLIPLGLPGCDRGQPPPAPTPEAEPTTTPEIEPWRFRPTLEQNLPEGAVAVPAFYDPDTHWPPASLARRDALRGR